MTESTKPYEYFAFISYKREDEKWAKWLQHKLEYYKLPSSVRKDNPDLPDKIRPVFRDKTDLSGGNLKEEIEKSLSESKYLIVICSPSSAKSPWVSKEVQYFIYKNKAEYIIPFIIGGFPNAENPKNECFPEGLRLLSVEKEILGININEMGRDAAAIKVVARMFGLRFDTLWQRYRKYKSIQIFLKFIIVILFIISAGIALSINHIRKVEMANSISNDALYLSLNGDRYAGIKKLSELLGDNLPITTLTESNIRRAFCSPKSTSLSIIPITSKHPKIAISPIDKVFAYGDENGIVQLYNLENGSRIKQREAINSEILDIAYFNDGRILVASRWDVKLLDGKTLETVDSAKVNIDPYGATMAIDKDHFILNQDSLSLYKISDGRINLMYKVKTHEWIKSFDLSLSSGNIITGASDHKIRIWNVKTHKIEWTSPELHKDYVSAIEIDEDNGRIISAGKDGKIIIWDLDSKKEIHQPFGHNSDGYTGGIYSMKYLPNKQLLFSASSDMTIGTWNINVGCRDGLPLYGHTTTIDDIDYGHGYIVSAAQNSDIRIWDYDCPSCISFNCATSSCLVSMYQDDKLFIHANEGVSLFTISKDTIEQSLKIIEGFIFSYNLKMSPTVLLQNNFNDGEFKISKLRGWKIEVDTIPYKIWDADLKYDETEAAVVAKDFIARYDINSKVIYDSIRNSCKYNRVLYIGKNKFIVANKDSIAIGDFKRKKILKTIPHSTKVDAPLLGQSFILSKYNNIIAIGYRNGYISIIDTKNLIETCTFKAHSRPISYLSFNKDGSLILSISSKTVIGKNDSNEILVSDVENGNVYFDYRLRNILFNSALFDEYNSRIIASDSHGKIYYITFPSIQELLNKIKNFEKSDRLN